jgi:hypothetical protein
VRGNFDRLFTESLAWGQPTDDTMREYGIDPDVTVRGEVAGKRPSAKDDDGPVYQMRAMVLTSDHQLALKVQRETARLDREIVQMKRVQRDVDNWMQLNSQCEAILLEQLQKESDARTGDMSPRY